jgi:hypothetical protein
MSRKDRTGRAPRGRRGFAVRVHDDDCVAELQPAMTAASVDEVLAAMKGFHPDRGWAAVADRAIPMFQRVRPYPPGFPEPVRVVLPPGVSVTFALDMGPAFSHIDRDALRRWGISIDDVRDRALANLALRAQAARRIGLLPGEVDGVPIRTLQSGTGSASTFVLVPHLLPPLFGPEPQFFIAPMRDVLISLPADVDRPFAAWLIAELAAMDANHLAPIGFAFRGGSLTVETLGDALATA